MNNDYFEGFCSSHQLTLGYKSIKDKELSSRYHIQKFLNITQAMFDYEGLPDTIPQEEAELLIQCFGAPVVTKVQDKLYMFRAGLGGEPSAYYRPTVATIANPYLNYNAQLTIGKDCVIVPNDPLYIGLLPIFERYATLLTENEISMLIASINTRIAFTMSATIDKSAASAKEFLNGILGGDLGVITDPSLTESSRLKIQPGADAGAGTLKVLIEHEQYLKGQALNEVGLNANFNMKREALNSAESALNEDALLPFPYTMLKARIRGWDAVNRMYGTEVKVNLSNAWKNRLEEYMEEKPNAELVQL